MHTEESMLNELFGSGFGSDTGLLNKLPQLCAENVTTAELVEALDLLPHIARCLRNRISARNLIGAATRRCPAVSEDQILDAETDAAMEEAEKIQNAHVDPIFAPMLNMMRGGK